MFNTQGEHSLALAAVITLAVLVVLGWVLFLSSNRERKQSRAASQQPRRFDSVGEWAAHSPSRQHRTHRSESSGHHNYDPTPSFHSAADYGGSSGCSSSSSSSSSCSSD